MSSGATNTFDGVPPPGENGVKQAGSQGCRAKDREGGMERRAAVSDRLRSLAFEPSDRRRCRRSFAARRGEGARRVWRAGIPGEPGWPQEAAQRAWRLQRHDRSGRDRSLVEATSDALVAVPMGRRAGMLAIDADANGLHEPIALTPDNLLLDGRHRALACAVAGIEPTAFTYDGDPWLYSLSKNAHRRHMSRDRVAMVVAVLTIMRHVGANRHEGGSDELPSIAMVAEKAGVTETAIKSANAVLKHGTRDEVEAVKLGRKPLRKTADTARACMRATAPSGSLSSSLSRLRPRRLPIRSTLWPAQLSRYVVTANGDRFPRSRQRSSSPIPPSARR